MYHESRIHEPHHIQIRTLNSLNYPPNIPQSQASPQHAYYKISRSIQLMEQPPPNQISVRPPIHDLQKGQSFRPFGSSTVSIYSSSSIPFNKSSIFHFLNQLLTLPLLIFISPFNVTEDPKTPIIKKITTGIVKTPSIQISLARYQSHKSRRSYHSIPNSIHPNIVWPSIVSHPYAIDVILALNFDPNSIALSHPCTPW